MFDWVRHYDGLKRPPAQIPVRARDRPLRSFVLGSGLVLNLAEVALSAKERLRTRLGLSA